MKKHVRTILHSALILLILGVFVEVSAQPVVVDEIPNNSTNFNAIGDFTYFSSADALWRTDGTDGGTMLLGSGFTSVPSQFTEFNGMAIFRSGSSVWRSDGTSAGTVSLTSGKSNIHILSQTEDYLFFGAADAATGYELYRTDGTPSGTMMIRDLYPGSGTGLASTFTGTYAVAGNEFFFPGNNGVNGMELWKTDGSSSGTSLVKDIDPGPGNGASAFDFFSYNDLVFFSGTNGTNGHEPWISDGTPEGTNLLQDTNPGPASSGLIDYRISHDGFLYFLIFPEGNSYGAPDLWKTAGTTASTSNLKTVGIEADYNEYVNQFIIYNDKVYFLQRLNQFSEYLWVTDGTPAGTHIVSELYAVEDGISFFDVVGDYIVIGGGVQGYPTRMLRSDGEGEPEAFYNLKSGGFFGDDRNISTVRLTKVGDLAFFADHDGFSDTGSPYNEEDYFHLYQTDAVTTASMRTMYGVNTIGTNNIIGFNGKVLFTTQNNQAGSIDNQKRLWIYDPSDAPPPPMASFTLVNAQSDEDVRRLLDGAYVTIPTNVPVNIRYDHSGEQPGSVVFKLSGVTRRTETAPPYALAGDINGDYSPWQEAEPGTYELTAIPYSQAGGQGTPGEALTITFTIQCQYGSENCTPTGTILWEQWTGIPGNSVSAIPINAEPDDIRHLSKFEGNSNIGTNYGARYRGYVIPPATGSYTFWIASNDNSELWLSTDDDPANKIKIASVTGATNPREWNKFTSQKSAPVALTEGVKYYIEALHKQGAGTDHMSVGWQLPGGEMERPIPGTRLSLFIDGGSEPPTATITSPTEGQTFTAPADIMIEANASDGSNGEVTKVDFYAGPKDETGTKIGEDPTAPYSFLWENVGEGNYDVYTLTTDEDGNITGSPRVNITVRPGSACASGTITREYWAGVQGNEVSQIPLQREPDDTGELTIFEGPSNTGTNYGSRIRGYICPPVTGNYNFWIASNDNSELWISTDDDPANKRLIAYTDRATGPREWNKFGSQRSTAVRLIQGQRYYIEALHKQGIGTDHIAVGWSLPDGTFERPIPGNRLSPFEMSAAIAASEDASMYSQIDIYPNPAASGAPELTISGYEGINKAIETYVEISNMTGDVVVAEKISCGGDCSTYLMKINEQLIPGLYLVNLRTNGTRFSKRLLVK